MASRTPSTAFYSEDRGLVTPGDAVGDITAELLAGDVVHQALLELLHRQAVLGQEPVEQIGIGGIAA